MYKDSRNNILLYVIAIALLVIALLWTYKVVDNYRTNDNSEESMAAIKAAVERAALQCYVIEGAYPVDLRYLEDNYGLKINTEKYYVVYNAYAENQLPDIRVAKK